MSVGVAAKEPNRRDNPNPTPRDVLALSLSAACDGTSVRVGYTDRIG